VQAQASNHLKLLRHHGRGGERWGKGRAIFCQVWAKKVSVKQTNGSVERFSDGVEIGAW